ncbi:hypothetical protein [Streptomyces sp. NBC_00829]|uniref:hypothetical protein n=1 Tax=Streptomyces sp. NBC_00829 TaxID=2903679 RepID=UPI00386F7CC8|nr:hypothetical protein OG293_33045 [Streptomyces sp. NBC_00829]
MWNDERDGRREHEGLARALNASGAPDRRIWNGHAWQEEDSWQNTGLVTFDLRSGAPAALRAECQCAWHGPSHPVSDSPAKAAVAVKADWEKHLAAKTEAMYPVDVADDLDDLFGRLYSLAQQQPLATLAALRELEGRTEPLRVVAVARARYRKEPWQKLADALGVTRQSAWEKYQFAGNPEDVEAAYAKTVPHLDLGGQQSATTWR